MLEASRRRTAAYFILSVVLLTVIGGGITPARVGAAPAGSPFGFIDYLVPSGDGVSVGGWVIDPDTNRFTDVHVYSGPNRVGYASANNDRPDVGQAFPGLGSNHGFALQYALAPGVHNICIIGINIGAGSSTTLGCATIAVAAPWGSVDAASRVANSLRVRGWAADPDTADPTDVVVELGGSGRFTIRADQSRPDVGSTFPWQGSQHGFEANIPLPSAEGVYPLCVYALGRAGGPPYSTLQCRSVQVTSSPIGAVDVVAVGTAMVRVAGWALDPDTTGPIEVGVSVQNVGVYWFPANLNRPDLPGAGYDPNHGFSVDVPVPPGLRNICIAFRNVGAGGDRPMGCTLADSVPIGSGSGRRVVYWNLGQHVWLVGSDGFVVRSYDVSGRYLDPPPGQYSVLSHLRWTSAGHDDISMEYFVEFLDFEKGYGFHTIPVFADGTPLQSESELGQFRSAGCVRQRRADAIFLYNWSDLGDPVIVI